MRGKDIEWNRGFPNVRITPAYAGKSSIVSPSSAVDWDHPRLCGEKFQKNRRSPCYKGSPPPMRGKVVDTRSKPSGVGITPAYAGKSKIDHFQFFPFWDHPRLCGEKTSRSSCFAAFAGSPPPMRGKATTVPALSMICRITPAYAGKRSIRRIHIFQYQDHPRLCGEKKWVPGAAVWSSGSPPPMRGKG